MSAAAESVLMAYSWPGNVRELENLMRRVAALHSGDAEVSSDALMPFLTLAGEDRRAVPAVAADASDSRTTILEAYAAARGNKSLTARALGVSRKTLYARLKRLGLELP
jgi:two-component system response regulator AtoC